jgi:hypothetical protein
MKVEICKIKNSIKMIEEINDDFKNCISNKNSLTSEELQELKNMIRWIGYLAHDASELEEIMSDKYYNSLPRK